MERFKGSGGNVKELWKQDARDTSARLQQRRRSLPGGISTSKQGEVGKREEDTVQREGWKKKPAMLAVCLPSFFLLLNQSRFLYGFIPLPGSNVFCFSSFIG